MQPNLLKLILDGLTANPPIPRQEKPEFDALEIIKKCKFARLSDCKCGGIDCQPGGVHANNTVQLNICTDCLMEKFSGID